MRGAYLHISACSGGRPGRRAPPGSERASAGGVRRRLEGRRGSGASVGGARRGLGRHSPRPALLRLHNMDDTDSTGSASIRRDWPDLGIHGSCWGERERIG